MNKIHYRIKKASALDVSLHLNRCSEQFVPALSSYVNIDAYSEKIYNNAVTFEAWSQNKLAGLVACYFNNDKANCFITNVSVENDYAGMGIAKNLMNLCTDYAELINYKQAGLEVNIQNNRAVNFYKNLGFIQESTTGETVKMKFIIMK